jgi:hypothetical protein
MLLHNVAGRVGPEHAAETTLGSLKWLKIQLTAYGRRWISVELPGISIAIDLNNLSRCC